MNELIEKIKAANFNTILIYSILIVGIVISIFMFSSSDEDTLNVK